MENDYRQYFEAMPCYLTVQDRDLKIVNANRRFREDFGDWEGRYCFQVYKHRSEKCEVCPVERTFRDGQGHESEEQVKSMDGKQVAVIVNTTPIRDPAGEIVAVMEMSTDITEIKILQSMLTDSRARYRKLFEEVPCYISIQDKNLRILEANRRFREDFGEYLGCKCFQTYKHRTEECLPCPVQATFEDGEVHHSEEVVTSLSGEQVNVLVYTTPLIGPDGKIQSVMEMSTNITEIRKLQSQLASLGLLIGSISHSIKGLLNSLQGGIYMVNSGLAKNNQERFRSGWDMVVRNVARIKSTVLDILYYAKDRPLNLEEVEARELLSEIKELLAGRAAENNIKWREAEGDGGKLQGDRAALRSALVNLVENAIDACRADVAKPEHEIQVSSGGDENEVFFTVTDNGQGMDQETREKVFSLFFSSKGAQGTGLGLFVANQIVAKHGGRIVVDSSPGNGASFSLLLPRQAKPDPE
jgi:PAS domain S-box-containing protein